ncbi:CRAL/TRIO domain-containing protein [Hysterangium stoloniferum]|nr:CRAL/TRIO domain-containing protein [Hysterangium stoloniferum]
MTKTTNLCPAPASGVVVKPREYTNEQLDQINALHEYARTLQLPLEDPYHVWEERWLNSFDCCGRYMRASKWKFDEAKRRIKGTMEWRREFKPDLIKPEDVRVESETGKIILNGYDVDGRPVLYMRPGRENTPTSPRQIQHLIFCLERAIDFMPPGQDSLVIVVDYASTTMRTNPSIGTARKVLHILQQHYVERLGRAIVVNLPMLLNFFYKGIGPFLDPVTKDKMRFNPDLPSLIPLEQLDSQFGGSYEYEFEPESYWQQLIEYVSLTPSGDSRCGINENGTRRNFPPELESVKDRPSDDYLLNSDSTPQLTE